MVSVLGLACDRYGWVMGLGVFWSLFPVMGDGEWDARAALLWLGFGLWLWVGVVRVCAWWPVVGDGWVREMDGFG